MKKKIVSSATAILMIIALVLTPMAADTTDIYITGTNVNATHVAYKLLNLTTSLIDSTCHTDSGTHTDDCWSYNYSVNDTYRAELQTAVGEAADTDASGTVSDDEVIAYISSMTSNSEDIAALADILYAAVKDMTPDATGGTDLIGVDQGYYLIAQTSVGDTGSISLVILDTAGKESVTIATKSSVPTLVKTIEHELKEKSHSIGDAISYYIEVDIPENIESYDSYKYIIHDNMSEHIKFTGIEAVSLTYASTADLTEGTDYTLYTKDQTDSYPDTLCGGCTFEIVLNDIIATAQNNGVYTENEITGYVGVDYHGELLDTATIGGTGNENYAYAEYSNDPYWDGTGEEPVGETEEDKTTVYTYELVINKVNTEGNPLDGAEFSLERGVFSETQSLAEGSWDQTVESWEKHSVDVVYDSAEAKFTFTGLGEGVYKLTETKTPDGYSSIDPIEFQITREYDDDGNAYITVKNYWGEVVSGDVTSDNGSIYFRADATTGIIEMDVENVSGSRLPSTGGTGTYMIYGIGGLILAVGIILIVIKRGKKEDSTIVD